MTHHSEDLSNLSMLDLFGMEVENQASILNENLLILETQPHSHKELEYLMRAAHSIKGAARIVQIDPAVKIAHVMEDCFVAAQEERLTIKEQHIDVLLEGVDLLLRIGQVKEADLEHWLSEHEGEIETVETAIRAILNSDRESESIAPHLHSKTAIASDSVGSPLPGEAPTQEHEQPKPLASPLEQGVDVAISATGSTVEQPPQAPQTSDRVVRLSADNLNRLMALAGESLVEANWLQPFADALLKLKTRQLELSNTIEKLQESLADVPLHKISEDYLNSALLTERECRHILGDRINELELFARRFSNLSDRLYREVIDSHMRPFSEGVQAFPRMMRDLAKHLGKQVKFEITGKSTKVDRDILEKLEAPLTHMLRNALDHGIEFPHERLAVGKPLEGYVRLEAAHRAGMLSITISDDGRGIDLEHLRQSIIKKQLVAPDLANQLTETELMEFLFLPRFSTVNQVTEISGRGFGLDIAKSMVQEVGGFLRAHSQLGKGMIFHLQLPLTLSVIRTLLVEISGEAYAFPLTRIEQIAIVCREEIFTIENRQYFSTGDRNIGLVTAHQVLELNESHGNPEALPVIVISDRMNYYGLVVDRFLGERDLVVRPLDPRLGKVQDISAAALMEDGSPVLIMDVEDIVRSIDNLLSSGQLSPIAPEEDTTKIALQKRILVVDDSITVREMERKLLQNNGYFVEVAVNGMEAWNAARTGNYDLIITDVDMPRMNGIELVNQIKQHAQLKATPVIIVSYKDREEDRILGLEAGANYYLTKSSFHDDTFLNAVIDTIGNT